MGEYPNHRTRRQYARSAQCARSARTWPYIIRNTFDRVGTQFGASGERCEACGFGQALLSTRRNHAPTPCLLRGPEAEAICCLRLLAPLAHSKREVTGHPCCPRGNRLQVAFRPLLSGWLILHRGGGGGV